MEESRNAWEETLYGHAAIWSLVSLVNRCCVECTPNACTVLLYSCMQATAVQAALRQQLALGRAEVRAWPTLVQDLEAARPWRLNPSPLRIPMLLLPLPEQEVCPAQLLLEETGRRPETRKVAEVGCHQSAHVAVSGPGKRIHSSELRVAMS